MLIDTRTEDVRRLLTTLDGRIATRYPTHPFDAAVSHSNFEYVIAEYLAMSIAFPYIQAGATYRNFKSVLDRVQDTDTNVEITGAIGAFLVWDEFGGHSLVQRQGLQALSQITQGTRHIHSQLLRHDIRRILGYAVTPRFSDVTTDYLDALRDGLSDSSSNRNVAYMVAFEKHAERMIHALWNAVTRMCGGERDDSLTYFYEHVGGDAPAEAIHVSTTIQMIESLIPRGSFMDFVSTCIDAYALNVQWCEAIIREASSQHLPSLCPQLDWPALAIEATPYRIGTEHRL